MSGFEGRDHFDQWCVREKIETGDIDERVRGVDEETNVTGKCTDIARDEDDPIRTTRRHRRHAGTIKAATGRVGDHDGCRPGDPGRSPPGHVGFDDLRLRVSDEIGPCIAARRLRQIDQRHRVESATDRRREETDPTVEIDEALAGPGRPDGIVDDLDESLRTDGAGLEERSRGDLERHPCDGLPHDAGGIRRTRVLLAAADETNRTIGGRQPDPDLDFGDTFRDRGRPHRRVQRRIEDTTCRDGHNDLGMISTHAKTSVRRDRTTRSRSVAAIRQRGTESNDAFGFRLVQFRRPAKGIDHDRSFEDTLTIGPNMLPTTAAATLGNVRAPRLLPRLRRFENVDDLATQHRAAFFGDVHSDEFPGQSTADQHDTAIVCPAKPVASDRN